MNNEQFAKRLRALRMEKGLTQEQVAQKLGVSAQSVSRWECANTLPDVMLLPQLSRLYGVTVDDLYREDSQVYANYAQRLLAVYEATRRSEDFLAAEQEFTRLLSGAHTADDLRSAGVLYHYMTKYCAARAIEHLDQALEQVDQTQWVWSSTAQQKIALLCDLGRGQEEAARYAQQLRQHPEDVQMWILSLCAHQYAGLLEEAYTLAREAVHRFPEDPAIHVYAGNICGALQRYEEAFSHWHRVLELDRGFYDALYAMAFCYEEQNQYDRALEIWQRLLGQLREEGFVQECQLPEAHIKQCREHLQK